MQYGEMARRVQELAGLASREEAERALTATLQTLGERVTGGEITDLLEQLPDQATFNLPQGAATRTEAFTLDTFLERIAARTGSDVAGAQRIAQAVLAVIREAVSPGELEDLQAQLPDEITALFQMDRGRRAEDAVRGPEGQLDAELMDRAAEAGISGAFGAAPGAQEAREALRREAERAFGEDEAQGS